MGAVKNKTQSIVGKVSRTATGLGARMPGGGAIGAQVARVPGIGRFPGMTGTAGGGGGTPRAGGAFMGAQGALAPFPAARQGYADMLGIKNFTPRGPAPAVPVNPAMPVTTTPQNPNKDRLSWRGRFTGPQARGMGWMAEWERRRGTMPRQPIMPGMFGVSRG